MKYIFLIFVFFGFLNSYSQIELKKVLFEVYYEKNKPFPAGNLMVETAEEFIGTQTDLKVKAELNIKNFDVDVELEAISLYVKFRIPENTELVKINIKKKEIKYYSKNRILKKEKLDIS